MDLVMLGIAMNTRPSGLPFRTFRYGGSPAQVGDLYLPRPMSPMIVLLHGGFWRAAWGRDHIAPIAMDLMRRGFTVWNLEYRRVGGGGGWPETLEDVRTGIDYLSLLGAAGEPLDLRRVTLIGHSAGGHLALASARPGAEVEDACGVAGPRITAVVGLAAVADLAYAHELGCGNGAVSAFMGGSPRERPERYVAASPAQRLPLGVRQLLIHGTADQDVPVELSRRYARDAVAAGDPVEFIELAAAGHMDFTDPASAAHATLCRWLARSVERRVKG